MTLIGENALLGLSRQFNPCLTLFYNLVALTGQNALLGLSEQTI